MTDYEILQQLELALAPDPTLEPPAASLVALHRAIDAASFARVPRPARRRPRLFTVAVAAGAVAVLTVGLAATSLNRYVREVAHDAGLPVDSPDLVDARARRDDLREALDDGDVEAVRRAAPRLRDAMEQLGEGERASLQPTVDELLVRADELLAPVPSTEPIAPTTAAPSTTVTPTTTVTTSVVPTVAVAPTMTVRPTTASAATTTTQPASNPAATVTPTDDGGGEVDDDNEGPGGDSGSGDGSDGGSDGELETQLDIGESGDEVSGDGESDGGESGDDTETQAFGTHLITRVR